MLYGEAKEKAKRQKKVEQSVVTQYSVVQSAARWVGLTENQ